MGLIPASQVTARVENERSAMHESAINQMNEVLRSAQPNPSTGTIAIPVNNIDRAEHDAMLDALADAGYVVLDSTHLADDHRSVFLVMPMA